MIREARESLRSDNIAVLRTSIKYTQTNLKSFLLSHRRKETNRLHTEVSESVHRGFKALLLKTTLADHRRCSHLPLWHHCCCLTVLFVFLGRTTWQRRRLILLTSETFSFDTCKQCCCSHSYHCPYILVTLEDKVVQLQVLVKIYHVLINEDVQPSEEVLNCCLLIMDTKYVLHMW